MTAMDRITHPDYCSPLLCYDNGADLVHREVPKPFLPTVDASNWFSVGRARSDETSPEGQVVWPSEIELRIRRESTFLDGANAVAAGRLLVEYGEALLLEEGNR